MLCPFCKSEDTQVKDSRPSEDGTAIRRRRQCNRCDARFTTFERVQLREVSVIKRDGSKVLFDRDKLSRSFNVALRKRNIVQDKIEMEINEIVKKLESTGEPDVASEYIGSLVMKALLQLDKVGYVRYASVYRNFADPKEFEEFVNELKKVSSSIPSKEHDKRWMKFAIALSEKSQGFSSENPNVGCVVVDSNGTYVGVVLPSQEAVLTQKLRL